MTSADATVAGSDAAAYRTRRSARRPALLAASAASAALVLAACAPEYDTYTDALWDNGDGFLAPAINELWNEDGTPTCAFPLPYQGFETRANASAVVSGFLFELTNSEPDPDGDDVTGTDEEIRKERQRRSLLQGSINRMYQWLHPDFDAKYGITGPDDLAPLKQDLLRHLPGLGENAPVADYAYLSSEYLIADGGEYDLARIPDIAGFIADNEIPLEFQGLIYSYNKATAENGEEYLLVREKDTGKTELWQGSDMTEMTNAIFYQIYNVTLTPGFKSAPYLTLTLVSDGCPEIDDYRAERWYILDYTKEDGQAADDPFGREEEPEPSPSPEANSTTEA